ncbi:MAG: IreB family regulatory phosphoprotein [Bacilli bacterium]|nr:IreB family regulatory phosphoprotein [Bacilli bacterium]MDD3895454.1 IreB family regulatory phosphoprotein [Bacilli bacterium]MDD4407457.1 IreB family regulatory phosphoprotein [Bacilli bacterium]
MLEKTNLYNSEIFEDALIKKTLQEVYISLEERGYNPVNQLVGYFISGDPGYISSYQDARGKISELDRSKVLITVLKDYLDK